MDVLMHDKWMTTNALGIFCLWFMFDIFAVKSWYDVISFGELLNTSSRSHFYYLFFLFVFWTEMYLARKTSQVNNKFSMAKKWKWSRCDCFVFHICMSKNLFTITKMFTIDFCKCCIYYHISLSSSINPKYIQIEWTM